MRSWEWSPCLDWLLSWQFCEPVPASFSSDLCRPQLWRTESLEHCTYLLLLFYLHLSLDKQRFTCYLFSTRSSTTVSSIFDLDTAAATCSRDIESDLCRWLNDKNQIKVSDNLKKKKRVKPLSDRITVLLGRDTRELALSQPYEDTCERATRLWGSEGGF